MDIASLVISTVTAIGPVFKTIGDVETCSRISAKALREFTNLLKRSPKGFHISYTIFFILLSVWLAYTRQWMSSSHSQEPPGTFDRVPWALSRTTRAKAHSDSTNLKLIDLHSCAREFKGSTLD
jgi:hypothetical protein